MFASKNQFLAKSGGYTIGKSVRLRSSASAYFNRTPASASNRKTWTYSAWIKLGSNLSTNKQIFGCTTGSTDSTHLWLSWSDVIFFQGWSGTFATTTAVFRDPSAWYHIVIQVDTTQATSTNRLKLWVNGNAVTLSAGAAGFPALNADLGVNQAALHEMMGRSASLYFDGYQTEINFIDGQALTPSSFGETNATTGVWQPKSYTGTYGTNGFELNFSDNSSNTATTIGKDYSGNGNNWTPNNISVTSGVTYDSMQDVPTLTSATAANYPVWNLLKLYAANLTITNGNLTASDTSTNATQVTATMRLPTSGKWYCEITATTISGALGFIGATTGANADGTTVNATFGAYRSSNQIYNLAGVAQTAGATYTSGDVIGMAVDVDNGTVQFYKNGTAQGATPSFTFTAGTVLVPFVATDNNVGTKTFNANFGQRPFSYTPPTGFVALNTYNLPASTITNGAAYMAATLYTGNGSTQSIVNTVNGVSFQPDFVWLKSRSNVYAHQLFDSIRGATNRIFSNLTDAENTDAQTLQSFNSNGFTVGTNVGINQNATTLVGWQWKAGGTAVSNTAGSITSTVSAGATQGFSVVTYTGNATNGATVGHGLGVSPSMIIGKIRSTTGDWYVWQTAMGDNFMRLNTTAAQVASTANGVYNTASFSSTVFALGSGASMNTSAATYVAYCFAAVAGYSAFGSYTGNGSTDGPFVYTGFRPRFILVKSSSGVFDWHITDTSRSPYNQTDTVLFPNSSAAETNGGGYYYDLLSNGFKCRNLGSATNGSGATYIFAAFAENPFRNALARQETIMFKHNNTPISLDTPFTIDGTSYPANWLRLTSIEEKNAVGIVEVPDETTTYDDRFYWGIDNPKQLEDITVTPEEGTPYVQKGMKSNWTAQVKDTANKLLAQTDWMVIRKAERSVDIPADTVAYRASVLAECTRLVTAIEASADVPAFIAVVTTQNWTTSSN